MKGNLKSQTVVWRRKYFGANGEGARDSLGASKPNGVEEYFVYRWTFHNFLLIILPISALF